MTKKRRSFSPEFKHEAANLVVDQGYFVTEACRALGIGDTALRRWVSQLETERGGYTPAISVVGVNISKTGNYTI